MLTQVVDGRGSLWSDLVRRPRVEEELDSEVLVEFDVPPVFAGAVEFVLPEFEGVVLDEGRVEPEPEVGLDLPAEGLAYGSAGDQSLEAS